MVSLSKVVAAVVENMENTGKSYEDVEAAVCNLKYNIWERENDYPTDIRDLLDKFSSDVV